MCWLFVILPHHRQRIAEVRGNALLTSAFIREIRWLLSCPGSLKSSSLRLRLWDENRKWITARSEVRRGREQSEERRCYRIALGLHVLDDTACANGAARARRERYVAVPLGDHLAFARLDGADRLRRARPVDRAGAHLPLPHHRGQLRIRLGDRPPRPTRSPTATASARRSAATPGLRRGTRRSIRGFVSLAFRDLRQLLARGGVRDAGVQQRLRRAHQLDHLSHRAPRLR